MPLFIGYKRGGKIIRKSGGLVLEEIYLIRRGIKASISLYFLSVQINEIGYLSLDHKYYLIFHNIIDSRRTALALFITLCSFLYLGFPIRIIFYWVQRV